MQLKKQILKRILYILENPQYFSQIEINWANNHPMMQSIILDKENDNYFANTNLNFEIDHKQDLMVGDEIDEE